MRWPQFIGGSNTSQSLIASCERTVNLYVEKLPRSGKNEAALFQTPGFQAWQTVADLGGRGAVVANGRLFWVIGAGFYEFSSTAVPTKWGTVAQDANPAQLIYNGVVGGQVGICSGGNVYSFDLATNTLSAAHLTGGYTHLSYAKAYGLALNPLTGKVNLSALNDVSTWPAGTFFRRSDFPDPWQAMFSDPNGLIWLPGTETFDVWYLANPSSTQPWAPLSGLCGRFGIVSPFGYGVAKSGMSWLSTSTDGGADVVITKGGTPEVVSTYSVANALASYARSSTLGNAEMMTYHDEGHTFMNLSMPSAGVAGRTWSLDMEQRDWAERGSWMSASGDYGVWAPRTHVYAFGKHLVGDRVSGTIWVMDNTLVTDTDGLPIRRLRRAPALTDEHKRIPIDNLELLMAVGVAGQGVNPLVEMRVSDDGGMTFGNALQASYGRVGQYSQRVYWNRLGIGKLQDVTVECVWSSNAPVSVIDAFINNQEGQRAA